MVCTVRNMSRPRVNIPQQNEKIKSFVYSKCICKFYLIHVPFPIGWKKLLSERNSIRYIEIIVKKTKVEMKYVCALFI